jgi:DNA-binding NtrC family response regulator
LDLYYRLNVIHLRTPPLRERPEDVRLLLDHFLSVYSLRHHHPTPDLSREALDALTAYRWPGNVRELKNVVERIAVRQRGTIELTDLPTEVTGQVAVPVGSDAASLRPATAEALYDRMIAGESFWTAVYEPFMSRDLTRKDVRDVVRRGLGATRGSYKLLVRLFNMPASDYKRLLNFLRKNDCHVAFQAFRTIGADERRHPHSIPGAAA